MRRTEPKKKFKLSLPVVVAAPLQELFFDSVLNRPAYGSISEYFTRLARDDLRRRGILTIADAARLRAAGLPDDLKPTEGASADD